MIIRKAKPEDSKRITSHILLAMEDILYNFIGEKSFEKGFQFIESLVNEKNNQYSYENCWVVEVGNAVVATALVYDGANLFELRSPVARKIKADFNKIFNPEDETQAGEYYIDCVGVSPEFQKQGIGKKLLQFLINEYAIKKNETLGLLVDSGNPEAKKLYLSLGFVFVENKTLVGKNMEHLQFNKKNT